jgi:hypothetical protein
MAAAVKSKIEEEHQGRSTNTILEDKPAADNEATVSALKARHPAAAPTDVLRHQLVNLLHFTYRKLT